MRITCNGQLALAVLLTSAFVFGCAEHEDNMQGLHSQEITFAPQMVNDWNGVTTRSVMQQNATAKVQQLADGLYLHTVVSPGFESDRQEKKEMTRGTLVTSLGGFGGHFGVSGHAYDGAASATATADVLYKADVQLLNNNWVTNESFFWPQKDYITFYGYVPFNHAKVEVADAATPGPMQIGFTVANDVDSQVDLMTAVSKPYQHKEDDQNVVPMKFQHQLTAVQFVIDQNIIPGYLEKIEFQNISMNGTLTVDSVYSETASWALGSKGDYTLDFTNGGNTDGISLTSGGDINMSVVITETPLLMIPQNFTSGTSRIQVTIKDGEERYDLSASLVDTKWLPGTTVTYKISTSTINLLRISGVTYPDSWDDASTAFNSIKSSYATNDMLGVYAIDANGAVVKENEPLTKTANGWEHNILFVPGLTYFAYYPYSSNGLAHSGTKNNAVVATAEDFFASGISAWTPAEDQNSAAELNAQDLQVGTGTVESASTISFAMAHSMGLASLTLAEGTIPEVRYFIVNASGSINENGVAGTDYIDIGEKTMTASTNFTTTNINNVSTKMLVNSRTYYYVVNPHQTAITITGPSEGDGKWTTPNVALDVTAGNYKDYSVNHHGAYYYKGWLYSYQGKMQTFNVPASGNYRIECWGASGTTGDESDATKAAHGGYVCGDISLTANLDLYVFVGEEGGRGDGGGVFRWYWNGGGLAQQGGGGASDVRTTKNALNEWNNVVSLRSRIIVAGAGGGGFLTGGRGIVTDRHPGDGGGLNGYDAQCHHVNLDDATTNSDNLGGKGGTQIAGGAAGTLVGSYDGYDSSTRDGHFGWGGYSTLRTSTAYCSSSGGGGWYGGGHGIHPGNAHTGGGGGSSYISGHAGCVGVTEGGAQQSGTANTVEKSLSHTGYSFTNTKMIDGRGYQWTTSKGSTQVGMPKPAEAGTETGHLGHGYIRIASLTSIQ